MGTRHPNSRLAKIHRNYTVVEIAALLGVHRNTVRAWIKQGLPTCDSGRPTLILGQALRAFLEARRTQNKQPCGVGQIYCVRCHAPRRPAGDMADYQPVTITVGNLVGMCPTCETMMYRRVNLAKLEQIRGNLDVRMPHA
jgi:excisionase family DNA binding protein